MEKSFVTFDEAATDPTILDFYHCDRLADEIPIGTLAARDGSVSTWDIKKRDGGYVIEICVIGQIDNEGIVHEKADEANREPVLLLPLRTLADEHAEMLGQDCVPTTFSSVEDAYAAFLDVVYATEDDEPELVHVVLANETSASGYNYEVSRAVLALLERTSEEELGHIMPPVVPGQLISQEDECRSALEKYALESGLPKASVTVRVLDVPEFWFASGWVRDKQFGNPDETIKAYEFSHSPSDEKSPSFPKTIKYDCGLFSACAAASEGGFCRAIEDELLPEGFSVWGFGMCACADRLYVAVASVNKRGDDVVPDNAWFATYVVGDEMLRLVGYGWTEDALVLRDAGHKIEWAPDVGVSEEMLRRKLAR